MTRAAIYIRVSQPRQAKADKVSLPEQDQRCRRYCEENGYTVVAVYSDAGISGATKKRPMFQQMLKDAQAAKFDVIVAWKADRLARGIYPCAALMEAVENTSITVETVAEPFDRTTFELRAVLGRIELENMTQRTQMGREGNIKGGNHHSKPPFGCDYNPAMKHWVINKAEANCVRRIFDWYIADVGVREIARRLNNAGVPTKTRSRLGWTCQKVSRLVDSECYSGIAYYNKRHGDTGQTKDRHDWIRMSVPAIIARETWERAQSRRRHNRRFSSRNTKATYLTQHILVCPECGYPFRIHTNRGKPRLLCGGMAMYPHLFDCRRPKTLPEHAEAERLWETVVRVVGSDDGLQMAIRSRATQIAAERETIQKQLKHLAKKRDDLKLEQDRVITGFRKGFYNEDQVDRQLRAIRAENEQYVAEEERLLNDIELEGDAQAVYQQAKRLIPAIRRRLIDGLGAEEKKEILTLLVRRALLDREGNLTIEFKVPVTSSFAYATSLHEAPHYCSLDHNDGGEPTNRST